MQCIFFVTDSNDSRQCPLEFREPEYDCESTVISKCPCRASNSNAPLCMFPETRVHRTIQDVAVFRDAYLQDLSLPPEQSRYNPMTTMAAPTEANPAASAGPATEDNTGQPPGSSNGTLNGLVLYERIQNPMEAVGQLGTAIAKSKMFGCPDGETGVAQGRIIALTCLAQRITPLDFMRSYHIIGGKAVMQAPAMLAEFRRRGGDHEIVECSDTRAAVRLKYGHGRGQKAAEFSLTWDEAQKEPWPWSEKGGKRHLKTNWETPKARANMLWARVVSEGIRRMMPEVNNGIYTPEEVSDYSGITYVPPESPVAPVNGSGSGSGFASSSRSEPVIDAEYKPAPPVASPASTPPAQATATPAQATTVATPLPVPVDPHRLAPIRPDQVERLKALKVESGVGSAMWKGWLGGHGVDSAMKLTALQAADCEEWLKRYVAANKAKSATPATVTVAAPAPVAVAPPPMPTAAPEPPPFDASVATPAPGPVTAEQLARLKQLVGDVQMSVTDWKAKLAEFGPSITSAKQLNTHQADIVIQYLTVVMNRMRDRDSLSKWADTAIAGN